MAAGKTVVGRTLARHLGFDYLDTGNMYRAITWLAIRSNIPVEDTAALEKLAVENPVRITNPEGDEVEIGGHRVGTCLRTPEVNSLVDPMLLTTAAARNGSAPVGIPKTAGRQQSRVAANARARPSHPEFSSTRL